GFNPSNQGDSIFISVPPLTDERRRDLVKTVLQMAEESNVAIRNIRRDANDELKLMQKEGELSEDEQRRGEAEDKLPTDVFCHKVDGRATTKESASMPLGAKRQQRGPQAHAHSQPRRPRLGGRASRPADDPFERLTAPHPHPARPGDLRR